MGAFTAHVNRLTAEIARLQLLSGDLASYRHAAAREARDDMHIATDYLKDAVEKLAEVT